MIIRMLTAAVGGAAGAFAAKQFMFTNIDKLKWTAYRKGIMSFGSFLKSDAGTKVLAGLAIGAVIGFVIGMAATRGKGRKK